MSPDHIVKILKLAILEENDIYYLRQILSSIDDLDMHSIINYEFKLLIIDGAIEVEILWVIKNNGSLDMLSDVYVEKYEIKPKKDENVLQHNHRLDSEKKIKDERDKILSSDEFKEKKYEFLKNIVIDYLNKFIYK
ncbi:MAG TPA: hypothetical protein ENI76_09540, partial [Ignavibacteria bacterium]|nr:hypothetical protein [Ignavibacteria bacterium]